jgi:predicted flap endonuclease-1-like 5' DNA nuclease
MTNETQHPLPKSIGRPATEALHQAGVTQLQQLAHWREADLHRLHGVGPKAMRILKEALAEIGLTFVA